jgi:hypothetical protein
MSWPFTMIVASVIRPDPFMHTLIWVSWASDDAHPNVHQSRSIVAPMGNNVDSKLSSTSIAMLRRVGAHRYDAAFPNIRR